MRPVWGFATTALVIDLSPINYVRVDPSARTVLVGAGCKWSDVDHATHAFGLAVPSGIISSTGVAGLTLGGGMGHLTRKYGLTIDNLLSVDMVLADGSFVIANAEENPDLFWAVRGGGGNFGIVTSFLFRGAPGSYGVRRSDALESGGRCGCHEVVSGVHHAGARRNERILRNDERTASTALPRGVALAEDVRDRLVLPGVDGTGQYDTGTHSHVIVRPLSSSLRPCRFRCCKGCSTASILQGCNGTGKLISSGISVTPQSRSTSNTGRPCRLGNRQCTCTR